MQMSKLKCQIVFKIQSSNDNASAWILGFEFDLAFGFCHLDLSLRLTGYRICEIEHFVRI